MKNIPAAFAAGIAAIIIGIAALALAGILVFMYAVLYLRKKTEPKKEGSYRLKNTEEA